MAGLEVGADDYVTKPFSTRELVSRVRAQLRRAAIGAGPEPDDDVVAGGDVVLDASRHEVRVRGEIIDLRPKEFQLLEMLLRAKGRLLTRETLIDEIWGPHYFGDTKTLDVHVKRVRAKIETDPHHPTRLVTVRGLGYKFTDE